MSLQYQSPVQSPDPTTDTAQDGASPDVSYAALDDPALQLGGNAFANETLLASDGSGVRDLGSEPVTIPACDASSANPGYTTYNFDPALDPLREALNNDCLSFEDRTRLMVQYRDAQISGMSSDAISTLYDARDFDPDNPVTLSGDKAGMHHNLYAKLADDPKMQEMMADLAGRVASADKDSLDIDAIYAETQAKAQALAAQGEDPSTTNLRALQAMATLANFNKFGKDGENLPKEVADKLPPGMWEKIQSAGSALQQSDSADAAVMSHGVPAKIVKDGDDPTQFTADHNYHFFSHAYLTAALVHDKGLSPDDAMKVSGLVGSQYELLPNSLGEGQGNSGIKDILMNAEGAAFGVDAMYGDPALPGMFDGPDVENRHLPDVHPKKFPKEVAEMADDAQSDAKWKLWQENNQRIVESQPPYGLPWYMQTF